MQTESVNPTKAKVLRRIAQSASERLMRAASLPVGLLTFQARARAVERLSDNMITTIATGIGPIRFYCPAQLPAGRAENLLRKEPETIEWIDSFSDGSVFWDVGANVGVYSLYAAAGHNVSVLSFEPLAANFHVLSKNIELNAFGSRVTAYCVALCGATGLGVLNMASSAMGAALSQFGQPGDKSPYCSDHTVCSMHGMIGFSIDDFIGQFDPPFPTYMKLDVDGLELTIIEGARRTLQNPKLRSLMVELSLSNKNDRDHAVSLLNECGFVLDSLGAPQETEAGVGANHLFQRS
ncbi:MAG TPA: FkbM family methyltransferase [Pyrinomonadaceae bacterium]|nr:FkbM family methyltransferase [Pyrinomonadaceae bacterium]